MRWMQRQGQAKRAPSAGAKAKRGSVRNLARLRLMMWLAASSFMFVHEQVHAQRPPGTEGPLPAYEHASAACYVLLRRQSPYVMSGNYPVCRAVLDQLNKSCDDPPQYDQRRFQTNPDGLTLPDWKRLDAASNLELINATVWSNVAPDAQLLHWQRDKERLSMLARDGTLRLFSAEVTGVDLRGGTYTAYRVENAFPGAPTGYNQPHLLLSRVGDSKPAEPFQSIHKRAPLDAELLKFADRWYVFGFSVVGTRFLVSELSRPTLDLVGATPVCSIQHVSDWKAGK